MNDRRGYVTVMCLTTGFFCVLMRHQETEGGNGWGFFLPVEQHPVDIKKGFETAGEAIDYGKDWANRLGVEFKP